MEEPAVFIVESMANTFVLLRLTSAFLFPVRPPDRYNSSLSRVPRRAPIRSMSTSVQRIFRFCNLAESSAKVESVNSDGSSETFRCHWTSRTKHWSSYGKAQKEEKGAACMSRECRLEWEGQSKKISDHTEFRSMIAYLSEQVPERFSNVAAHLRTSAVLTQYSSN